MRPASGSRPIRPWRHVPVIFMTGLTETEHVVRGLDAGGVDYVTKPIIIDELLARIRVHLANARSAQSARAALDASGRHLMAVRRSGQVNWSTPQASRLADTVMGTTDGWSAVARTARRDVVERPQPDRREQAFAMPGRMARACSQFRQRHRGG